MKTISTTAVVALMTASIGFGAMAPALAEDAGKPPAQSATDIARPAPGRDFRMGFGLGGPGFLGLERGAEAIEIALVRLSHAIELTDEQTGLLETFKTDALAAAATFESTVEGLRPATPPQGETAPVPDFADRFENRIAYEKARLTALEAMQPALTAFFDSLTDEQKAQLLPEHRAADGKRPGGFGWGGPGFMGHRPHHWGPGTR